MSDPKTALSDDHDLRSEEFQYGPEDATEDEPDMETLKQDEISRQREREAGMGEERS